MLKYEDGTPSREFPVSSTLLFISVPCEFKTDKSSVVMNSEGSLNQGADWAALRGSKYAVVSATNIEVLKGNVLWRIDNGTTTEGGYQKLPSSFPWKEFLLGGVVGAAVTHTATKHNRKKDKESNV